MLEYLSDSFTEQMIEILAILLPHICKRVQGFLVLVFLRRRRNLFVENYNMNRICPSGANLAFFYLLKLTGCAAGEGFAMMYWRSYKQVTPLA